MSIGQTKAIRRAIMGVLRPLSGDRATGVILARAASGYGEITVPVNSYLQPVTSSAAGTKMVDRNQLVRTTQAMVVTEAGTVLPVASLGGGAKQNLAKSTLLRWDPPLTGLVATATVHGAALAGGADPAAGATAAVKGILAYETMPRAEARDLFNAGVGPVPAVVVTWAGSGGRTGAGEGVTRHTDLWKIYVVTASHAEAMARVDEALDILDAIEGYLEQRSSYGGVVFSSPPAEVLDKVLVRANSESFIYAVTLRTHSAVRRIETRSIEDGDWALWKTTSYQLQVATVPPLAVVQEATYGFGEFDESFSDDFATADA